MSGEMLADGQSPMMMTVDQYNERVARTWALATEAENERIIALLTAKYSELANASRFADSNYYLEAIALIKGETNG